MFYRRMQANQAYLVLVSLLVVLLTLVAPAAPGLAATANAERFAAPQAVTPVASLTVPSTTMISEGFSFTAAFDNTGTGAEVGYGPYVDLFLPIGGVDATSNSGPNDGVTFTSATYLGIAVNSVTQTCAPDGTLTHPLTGLSVTCPALPGNFDTSFTWQFINLELPFGSFAADQPAADITVTANLSNYADLSTALPIKARGGFRYGADPLDNPTTDPPIIQASLTSADVTPTLIKLMKTYHGPEDETATGPNFPREYTVAVDIADGQTVTNLDISDYLPGNLQFVQVVSTSPTATCGTLPGATTPGGNLVCTFASVTGTTGTSDATVRFRFYVPLNDAGSNPVINASTGDDVQCINQAGALGDWTPLDPRDLGGVDNASAGGSGDPPEHILGCKSIAIQKGVANLTDSTNSPGDVLEYTLNFQVSDFFAFQNVIIDDLASDGQHFQSSFAPTLQVNGNDFTLAAASMDGGNVNIVCNYTGGPGAECDSDNGAANDGTTAIAFDISAEVTRGRPDGKLLGGCVPTAGGSDYDCDPFDNGATTATLKFRTVILDAYTDDYPSGDPSVDQGDILNNDVTISGDVLNNADLIPTGNSEADTSAAGLNIAQGSLEKTIYAKNGVACAPQPCSAVQGTPGDTITYRLRYTHPTSDFEQFSMEDFVPLPVFSATEVTSLSNTVCGTPAAGAACLGPADTYHLLSGAVTPAMTTNAANNTVKFTYGNFDDPTNPTSVVDILFTVTIEGDPFADGLYLTNQARSTEGTTQTTVRTADAIVQFQIFEPVLGIRKGVIATDKATATFSPATVAPTNVSVSAPGSACPRLSGSGLPVTSSNLGTTFTSDLSGLDAGDLATFVIVVENTGRGPNGAFDVRIKDDLPAGFVAPAGGINLCATDGTGALFSVTDLGGGLLSTGIELIDPGPTNPAAGALDRGKLADGTTVTDGRNIVILTFDLQLDSSVRPNQAIDNTATLFKYAGQEGGADFTATDRTDSAQVKISPPAFAKALTGTEVTDGDNGATQAVIGELITYELTVTIPEGVTPSAQIADTLATGLAFVDITSVTLSPGVSTANAIGTGANPANVAVAGGGGSFTVNFGNTTNANTDNGVAETIVIVFRAAVLNLAGNQAGTTLGNAATFSYDTGPSLPATAANVTLVEPRVLAGKEVSNDGTTWSASLNTGDASAPLYYRVRLSNGGAALAPNADVATTAELANFTSSGSIPGRFTSVPSPMDGVALAVGQRVLVKNQTTASQNGIYSITATSSGTFTLNRATDADTAAELYRSRLVKVGSGTANGGQVFELTSTVATLNTDAVVWTSMTSGALTAFDVTLNDPLPAVYASVALNNPVTTAGFGATPAPTFADFEIVGGVLRTKAGVSFDMPTGSSVELVLSGTLSNGVNPQQNLDNIATVLWTSLNDDKSSADTPTQRSVHNASSTERTGADGVGGALNDYAAKGSANAVSSAPILSKLIVATSESHTLENKVLADFTGTGFTSLAGTWASAQTILPEFVRIGSPATGTGGSGTLTFGSAQDLRGYSALGVAVRAAAGNAATTMRLTLTDSDGTTARFDVTMSSLTVGAPGFTQLTSVALTVPSAAPTGGNGVLNLEAIVSIQVAGSANNAVRWDIDRIVALRTLAVPGEIVRYRLTVELPEGTSPDFMVQDNLPPGMRFINDSTVRVAFVANGGGIASTTAGTGNATVPAVTDTGTALNLSGNGDTVSSFSLAVGSVNGLPIGEGTGFDSTVSSSRTDARVTADTYIDGTDPIFRLGTLVNSDNDADAEYVVIEFNALVTNDRDNTSPDNGSAQQAGVSLDNTFQTAINSSTSNTQVGSTSSANDFSRVVIVEPQINNLSKAITTAPVDAGDPIAYQIEFSNNTAHPAQYAPQVRAATTAAFSATFSPTGGMGGAGRFTGAPASVDGVTLAEGDRVLVNNQSSASQNGIYKVVDSLNGIWDRATDFDAAAEMNLGYRAFVASGTANGGRTFALDAAVTTINTSAISFSAVSANPAVQAATTGVLPGTYTFNATGGTGGTGRLTWTASPPATIDGVTLSPGTRILVKDQNSTAPSAQVQRGCTWW
ncbi:MAG: isopeptide-forming domain-containing fimbrial protein [Anaerolineae bacterium]|nr:isopeptide-forming domain-containing fimbrial protein [Anaerolineae bacterium]